MAVLKGDNVFIIFSHSIIFLLFSHIFPVDVFARIRHPGYTDGNISRWAGRTTVNAPVVCIEYRLYTRTWRFSRGPKPSRADPSPVVSFGTGTPVRRLTFAGDVLQAKVLRVERPAHVPLVHVRVAVPEVPLRPVR